MVILSGMVSDPDGTIASYAWEQTDGTSVSLSAAIFTAPEVSAAETLTFRLTVADGHGAEAQVTVGLVASRAAGAGTNADIRRELGSTSRHQKRLTQPRNADTSANDRTSRTSSA